MWDRVQRRLGEDALQRLSRASVGVIGLGSLGSQTTLLLAMSGVGRFILIDPDNLEEHNVVRHAADLSYVGRPKVEAMRELVIRRNPVAEVEAIAEVAGDSLPRFAEADLVILAGLGSEMAQAELGQKIRELGHPILVGGVFEKGIAGEVSYIDPKTGPCYSCFSSLMREIEPKTNRQVNYGLPMDEVKAEPGLGIHVARVASTLADWAVRRLIDDESVLKPFPGNLVILAMEEYEIGRKKGKPLILKPGSCWWMNVPKLDDCLICSTPDAPQPAESIDDLMKDEEVRNE
jgi:molybdopterin/thiamine biosynthesis adenylyltransferase